MPEIVDLTRRLQEIEDTLAKITAGELDIELEVHSEDDPLASIEAGINMMVFDLKEMLRAKEERAREFEEALQTITMQQEAITQLTTPILQIWDGILCLPIVGTMDTARSAEMTDALLDTVVNMKSRGVIIDLTGIDVMDTKTADHFIKTAKAVKFIGAEPIITGISPAIAQTLTSIGVDLGDIRTLRNLEEGLRALIREDDTPASEA